MDSSTNFGAMPYPLVFWKYMAYIKGREKEKENLFLPNLNLKLNCGSHFPLIERESLLILERQLHSIYASD